MSNLKEYIINEIVSRNLIKLKCDKCDLDVGFIHKENYRDLLYEVEWNDCEDCLFCINCCVKYFIVIQFVKSAELINKNKYVKIEDN